jgi:holliday junction DNA helicase RuvA
MIGFLRGRLVHKGVGDALIDVTGVGYQVIVPTRCLDELPGVGEEVVLHTHLHVRDDALALYGFATREERECFERLIGATGVGPRLAITILSVLSPEELRRAVVAGDRDSLVLVPGIGAKTAAKLLIELRDRLGAPGELVPAGASSDASLAEVRAALESLGYGADEVRAAVAGLPRGGETAELLRLALRSLSGEP